MKLILYIACVSVFVAPTSCVYRFGLYLNQTYVNAIEGAINKWSIYQQVPNFEINPVKIDGFGRIQAYVYYLYNNKIYIDLDEYESWSLQKFQLIIMHEIGHLLGYSHSNDKNSIMYTYYIGPP